MSMAVRMPPPEGKSGRLSPTMPRVNRIDTYDSVRGYGVGK